MGATTNRRQVIGIVSGWLVACAAGHVHAQGANGATDEKAIQEPWAYENNPGQPNDDQARIVITQAGETDNVWFGFTCAKDHRIFASVLDQGGIPGAVADDIAVEIQLHNITNVKASAKKVSDTVMAFNPELSEKLFIYAIHEKELRISYSIGWQSARSYTFQLQPNRIAFRGIIAACLPERPQQEL